MIVDALRRGQKKEKKTPEELRIEAELEAAEARKKQRAEATRKAQEAMERAAAVVEATERGEPLGPGSTPTPPPQPTPPPTPKPKEKAPAPKTPSEEVNGFLSEFNLYQLVPREFRMLNEAQQLKVVRDLKRRIVDIVKSDAQTQYSEDLKGKSKIKAIASSLVKEKDIKNLLYWTVSR